MNIDPGTKVVIKDDQGNIIIKGTVTLVGNVSSMFIRSGSFTEIYINPTEPTEPKNISTESLKP